MSSTNNMNVILSQGSTIKEVHNIKKQNLEVNQQFVAQHSEDIKKEDKSKVQEFEKKNKIEDEKEKKKQKDQKRNKKRSNNENPEEKRNLSEGKLIDIRV